MKFWKLFVLFLFVLTPFVFAATSHASSANKDLHVPVCPGPGSQNDAHCHARVVTDDKGQPQVTNLPAGYGPLQFLGAYGVNGQSVTPGTVIAIVDAYDHPNIKS